MPLSFPPPAPHGEQPRRRNRRNGNGGGGSHEKATAREGKGSAATGGGGRGQSVSIMQPGPVRAQLQELSNKQAAAAAAAGISSPAIMMPQVSHGAEMARLHQQVQHNQQQVERMLRDFKTAACGLEGAATSHDHRCCPFYHSERDRRRLVVIEGSDQPSYKAEPCTEQFDDHRVCLHGDTCSLCHSTAELLYHPDFFRKRLCHQAKRCPRGRYCAFAHTRQELLVPHFNESEEVDPSEEFIAYKFKTQWCPIGGPHDWENCVYAHTYRDWRRVPLLGYSSRPCQQWIHSVTSGARELTYAERCPRGMACPMAHGAKEQLYHPQFYKTSPCSEADCKRGALCAFTHGDHDTRKLAPLPSPAGELSRVSREPILGVLQILEGHQPTYWNPPRYHALEEPPRNTTFSRQSSLRRGSEDALESGDVDGGSIADTVGSVATGGNSSGSGGSGGASSRRRNRRGGRQAAKASAELPMAPLPVGVDLGNGYCRPDSVEGRDVLDILDAALLGGCWSTTPAPALRGGGEQSLLSTGGSVPPGSAAALAAQQQIYAPYQYQWVPCSEQTSQLIPPSMGYSEADSNWGAAPTAMQYGYAPMVWSPVGSAGMPPYNMFSLPAGAQEAGLVEGSPHGAASDGQLAFPNFNGLEAAEALLTLQDSPLALEARPAEEAHRRLHGAVMQATASRRDGRSKYQLREGLRTPSSLGTPDQSATPTEAPSPRQEEPSGSSSAVDESSGSSEVPRSGNSNRSCNSSDARDTY